jgi:hypothetical protein
MYAVAFTGGISIIENGILQLTKQFTENNTTTVSEFEYSTYTTAVTNPTTTTIEMGRVTTAAYLYIEADKAITVNITTALGTVAIPITKNLLIGIAATGITITTTSVSVVKVVICGA